MRGQVSNYRVHLAPRIVIRLHRHFIQVEVVQQITMDSDFEVQIGAEVQSASFVTLPGAAGKRVLSRNINQSRICNTAMLMLPANESLSCLEGT